MNRPNQRIDDPLWKGIIEHTFAHFLDFVFPDAGKIFDLDRGVEYLDKEFERLFPPETNNKGVRYVDKLVKVHLLDGQAKFILCHIEVQSSKGRDDLAERMFQYFYRIKDRYKVPITAIAILADSNRQYSPKLYKEEFMGTSLQYSFNCYKILEQDEERLRANSNPFAVVVLTAQQAILHRHANDEQLMSIKHDLYDEMMKRKMDRSARQGIYGFLSRYVSFKDRSFFTIFEEEVTAKTGKNSTMGIKEYLLDKATKEGKREERAKAEAEKLLEKEQMAKKMLANGFDTKLIADIIGLSIADIEKLK
ncbi:RpnC/YadD family protein [Sphingobacterium bambusae]|uniref:Transposase (putative) YhgA-like domain-containing protein n=1 Tax=Sphingobacterium bambusae TaxID=662858 RepID=A0ABW6BEL6_9SPHI|nr:hypothetical protein [Sphingobacterium bambusae]WPL49627.1 hypothetical protein SCB77_04065 [Sphingobacterium bambusae]